MLRTFVTQRTSQRGLQVARRICRPICTPVILPQFSYFCFKQRAIKLTAILKGFHFSYLSFWVITNFLFSSFTSFTVSTLEPVIDSPTAPQQEVPTEIPSPSPVLSPSPPAPSDPSPSSSSSASSSSSQNGDHQKAPVLSPEVEFGNVEYKVCEEECVNVVFKLPIREN